jgi:hypothetical protein
VRCLLRPQGKVEDREEGPLHLKVEAGAAQRLQVDAELEADGDRIRR